MVSRVVFMALALFGILAVAGALSANAVQRGGGGASGLSLEAAWSLEKSSLDTSETKANPIKRVVALLHKMKDELGQEAENEGEMYEKQVCWCETNQKEKENAIADAEVKDKDLSAEMEGRSAHSGGLSAEIAQLKKQIAADTATLRKALAIREGEAGGFRDEERDLVQAITNLKNAIQVLSRHQGGSSLAQVDGPTLASIRAVFHDAALKHELISENMQSAHASRLQAALLQTARAGDSASLRQSRSLLEALDPLSTPDALPLALAEGVLARIAGARSGTFMQAAAQSPYKSYNTRSDTILGVLQQMLEDFEGKLSSSQVAEMAERERYEKLSAAKADQLEAGKKKLDALEVEHADNTKGLSDAKETLELLRNQRSADVEFLRNLKLTCQDLGKQWAERSETRSKEIQAVAEAIAILTEDDNRESLAKAPTSLVQLVSRSGASATLRARRLRAAALLRRAAQEPGLEADDLLADWRGWRPGAALAAGGPRSQLSSLAMRVQLDGFTKVKEAMDKMVADLKAQQEEEVEFKAYCNKELDDNAKITYTKEQEKETLEGKLEVLAATIDTLKKEIGEAQEQFKQTELAIKEASQRREKENAEFQAAVSDQRAIQEILKKALVRLQDFYKKASAFVQQTPPVQFTKYKANSGASPVIGLLEQIIGDSSKLVAEATEGERSSQADYEDFVRESNKLKGDLSEAVSAKSRTVAAATLESEEAKSELAGTEGELESLASYVADMHSQCDWVLKNFEIRQEARLQEIEAIQAAKAILSGAK